MKKTKPFILLCCFTKIHLSTAAPATPYDLRCENLVNPTGIDHTTPRFSRKIDGAYAAQQTFYEIRVASDGLQLTPNRADLWRSARIHSPASVMIPYEGQALKSRALCYRRVRVGDENGQASPWSPVRRFAVGIPEGDPFLGDYIGLSAGKGDVRAPLLRKSFTVASPGVTFLHVNSLGYHEIYVNGTKAGDQAPHSYIRLYYMTRLPDQRIDIFNEGIGGDDAGMISLRTDKIFEHKPTVVTLSFGMNDTGYMDYTDPANDPMARNNVATACKDYQLIEAAYQRYPDVKKIRIGRSPYDETSRFNKVPFPGKNALMEEISDFLQQRAQTNGWSFLDFNGPMTAINKREQQTDTTFTLCGGDRIHPTTDGHMVMAYLFPKAQGFANKPVADIRIDASEGSVNRSENCRISERSVSSQKISFIYQANALPYPIDSSRYEKEQHTQADALKGIVRFY